MRENTVETKPKQKSKNVQEITIRAYAMFAFQPPYTLILQIPNSVASDRLITVLLSTAHVQLSISIPIT